MPVYYPSETNRALVADWLRGKGWMYTEEVLTGMRGILSRRTVHKTVLMMIEEGTIEMEVRPNTGWDLDHHAGGNYHYIRLKEGAQ